MAISCQSFPDVVRVRCTAKQEKEFLRILRNFDSASRFGSAFRCLMP
jgi:hypothetical protein